MTKDTNFSIKSFIFMKRRSCRTTCGATTMARGCNIVCSSLTGGVDPEYNIARYNFHYETYSSLDFIAVKDKEAVGGRYAFVAFKTDSFPLDRIQVAS